MNKELNEPELNDDYPVYKGFYYVMDGRPKISHVEGTVKRLKVYHACKTVQRCDIVGRDIEIVY